MLSCKAYVHGGCVEGEGRCVGRRQNVGAAAGAVAGAFHTRSAAAADPAAGADLGGAAVLAAATATSTVTHK